MKYQSVAWECKHCGHRHFWKWGKNEFFDGDILMECEKCGKGTLCNLQPIGKDSFAAFWLET
jgi:hypothetical protein